MAKKAEHSNKTNTVSRAKVIAIKQKDKLLPRLSLFFFDRPRFTAIVFLSVFLFGLLSYTTLLKREGFPSINFPIASINGTYIGDAKTVDEKVALPIAQTALKQSGVSSVQSQAFDNFFNVFIQYNENIDAQKAATELEKQLSEQKLIPPQAQVSINAPYFSPAGVQLEPVDIGITVYAKNDQDLKQLLTSANTLVTELNDKKLATVKNAFIINPFQEATNPFTGQKQLIQQSFDRYGQRNNDTNLFYNSVFVGVTKAEGADLLKFDDEVNEAIKQIGSSESFKDTGLVISASYAPDIRDNISELQRELLIALLAVLIVGALVIALRASFITVLALIMIIFGVIGLLYILGYSLNVITLFALILSLALIVDDTIIMIEAIDAQRRRQKDARKTIAEATRKISRAMLSATFVAILSFAPLLFVGGVLGTFIRAIPITVISALLISLIVSLTFIPFLAKYILLKKDKMGDNGIKEVASGLEARVANFITKPMMWAKGSIKRLSIVGLSAVLIGFTFISIGGYFSTKVAFNIFPSAKDANNIQVNINFAPGTTLEQAQAITDKANKVVEQSLGQYFESATLYNSGNQRSATLSVELMPYKERSLSYIPFTSKGPRSPQLVEQLQKDLDTTLTEAQTKVAQVDAGPPAQPFTVVVVDKNREASLALANDIAKYFESLTLTRPDGTTATVTNVTPPNPNTFVRSAEELRVPVSAEFDGTDTTRLFNLAEKAIKEAYPEAKVTSFGVNANALQFDLGQEQENQDSFATLGIAFPLVLLAIFILLAIQFRSLLQPLLIFMAIPFSFFGISLSLYLTDNPFSFFAMLGFFALIGLSIKNTILLTDYANQARKAGMGAVDAISEALHERFRPLISTSATGVVAITPLAILSPFWQGLAVLIIFGLLSSTFLVVTVFPYYYLGAEYLRQKISRKNGLLIFGTVVLLLIVLSLIF